MVKDMEDFNKQKSDEQSNCLQKIQTDINSKISEVVESIKTLEDKGSAFIESNGIKKQISECLDESGLKETIEQAVQSISDATRGEEESKEQMALKTVQEQLEYLTVTLSDLKKFEETFEQANEEVLNKVQEQLEYVTIATSDSKSAMEASTRENEEYFKKIQEQLEYFTLSISDVKSTEEHFEHETTDRMAEVINLLKSLEISGRVSGDIEQRLADGLTASGIKDALERVVMSLSEVENMSKVVIDFKNSNKDDMLQNVNQQLEVIKDRLAMVKDMEDFNKQKSDEQSNCLQKIQTDINSKISEVVESMKTLEDKGSAFIESNGIKKQISECLDESGLKETIEQAVQSISDATRGEEESKEQMALKTVQEQLEYLTVTLSDLKKFEETFEQANEEVLNKVQEQLEYVTIATSDSKSAMEASTRENEEYFKKIQEQLEYFTLSISDVKSTEEHFEHETTDRMAEVINLLKSLEISGRVSGDIEQRLANGLTAKWY